MKVKILSLNLISVFLLGLCASAHGANIETKWLGRTMLIRAADGNYPDTVSLLLQRGAQKGARDDSGQTALMAAAEKGNLDVVRVLVASGADVDTRSSSGRTALDYAVEQNKSDVAKFLRDRTRNHLR